MAAKAMRVPQLGEKVGATGQYGAFIVVGVHKTTKTVDLQLVNKKRPVQRNVPWSVLAYAKKKIPAGM
jgi:hypothetical protein